LSRIRGFLSYRAAVGVSGEVFIIWNGEVPSRRYIEEEHQAQRCDYV